MNRVQPLKRINIKMRDLSSSLHYAVELLSVMSAIITKEDGEERPISLREVIQVNDTMSLNFLEQISRKLRIAEILTVVRGPGGGYLIANECKDITIQDLLDADILRHTSGKKEIPPFDISKSLEDAYSKHMTKFRETKLTDLKGFGMLKNKR